jgi:hypothetical protein
MVSEVSVHHGGEGMVEQGSHIRVARKQREWQEVARDSVPPRLSLSNLPPPAMLHLIKFPELPKIASPARDYMFNTWAFWWGGGALHIQT